MAAPTEVLTKGTAGAWALTDEPTSSPTIMVEKISRKSTREAVWVKNVNQTDVRCKLTNPTLTFSFTGQLNSTTTGIAVAGPGATISSLSNFATTYRTFDPAIGTLFALDFTDDVERLNDAPMTSFDVVHKTFVV